ncbi:DsbA family protein [Patescibacteria group bacterium]|nr:DsbA family protein [Patescibacteria group bacterium]
MNETIPKATSLTAPVAIVIAGILIAGAVLYSNKSQFLSAGAEENGKGVAQTAGSISSVRPVSDSDHIRGNPNALVKIVEYSDFECPFCKRFHDTMNQIMDEYGESGQVAWVYRHFPLDQLHPKNARIEAIASECVNELGGNDAFWKFADRFFERTPSNDQTDVTTVLPQIVRELGINEQRFNTCMDSGTYDQHIESDIVNAVETGGQGTPWSIVIAENGRAFPLSGAQPYASVKQLIEIALKEK